jgi:hypothetical protein
MKGRIAALGARCVEDAVALVCAGGICADEVCAVEVCAEAVIASAQTHKIVAKVRFIFADIV